MASSRIAPGPTSTAAHAVAVHALVPRPDAEAAVKIARRRFLAQQRIDVGAIAEELEINRTTIYRWFGGRDELVAQTLWSLTRDTFVWAARQTRATGRERIFDIMRLYTEAVGRHPAYRHFLRNEPEAAARVLFAGDASLRARLIDWYEQLLLSEPQVLAPDVDPRVVAFAIVRVGEVFFYGDQLGSAEPNVDELVTIIRLILGSPAPAAG
jgi:AcrR family transcriptional regulator